VTPSRITRASAEAAARQLGLAASATGPLEVWGVLRAYHTRHGEGPFPSEDAGLAALLPEPHNGEDGPAGRFRVGWFDAVLARYALAFAGPIDRLAVTCLDRVATLPERAIVEAWRGARPSEGAGADPAATGERLDTARAAAAVPILRSVSSLPAAIAHALGRRIDVGSWGPSASAKRPG
jgi:adenylosuccinate synthase